MILFPTFVPFATGWGLGGKTDVCLKAVNITYEIYEIWDKDSDIKL